MGAKYQAQQRVEHVAIACEPDMIRPTVKDPPLPFITYAEFDGAVNVSTNSAGNQHPLFTSLSKVPTCKGGPPGGLGKTSQTWNGQFVPTQWSSTVKVGDGWQVYHDHEGTINNGNAKAKVLTAVAPGAPSSPCIAALQVQFERLKAKASAELNAGAWQFTKGMASGAWGTIKGYGDAAGSVWDGISSWWSKVSADPIGYAQSAAQSTVEGVRSAGKAVGEVVDLGKALMGKDLSLDDILNGLEDLVAEIGPEAACALAKMLQDTVDAPGGVAESIGGLATEAALQIALAMGTGGAGNAAAAGAKAAKAGQYAGKGLEALSGAGAKLRGMGIKAGDDLKTIFQRLKARRAAGRNAPDTSPPKPKTSGSNPAPANATHSSDTHNKGKGKGEADRPCPPCPAVGGPVNPIQGCKVLSGNEDLDFILPGLLPLHWQRQYASNNAGVSWCGQGWSLPFTEYLRVKDQGQAVDFIDAFGRVISFPGVALGRYYRSSSEGVSLRRDGPLAYRIVAGDGSSLVFDHVAGSPAAPLLLCSALEDAQGRAHRIYYVPLDQAAAPGTLPEPRHLLAQGGQVLSLEFVRAGQHAGAPAKRLAGVKLLGDTSLSSANPLRQHLDAQASFEQRCEQLHQALAQDAMNAGGQSIALVRYDYSSVGDLTSVHCIGANGSLSANPQRRFAWQEHMLVQHELPDGWQHHYAYDRYDAEGKVVHHWQTIAQSRMPGNARPGQQVAPARRDWHFEYASTHTRVVETSTADGNETGALSRSQLYHFDAGQRWTGTTDALGQRTEFVLNHSGHVRAVIDPLGRRTEYLVDDRGRPLQIVNPNGERQSIVWHASLDTPVRQINALGAAERFELDAHGNRLASTDALGRTTRFVLDVRGLPIEIRDARGGVKRLVHNDWGQLTSYTDCSGHRTELRYDALGNLAGSTNALGQSTQYQHDARGRLLRQTQVDGSQEHFRYDDQGRLIEYIDTAGRSTCWALAADGLPVCRINALGQTFQYFYDAHRRLSQLVNENGDTYAFEYDALDRLVGESGFDGKRTRYQYDAAGQLQNMQELGDMSAGSSIETRFDRDLAGRLLAKHCKPAGQAAISTRFAYDAAGQLLCADNAHSRIELHYDPAGQLIREQLTAAGLVPVGMRIPLHTGGRQHTLHHRYDELGNRIATELPDGRVLNMLMYGSGHVHQLNLDGQVISDLERDALHREVGRSQGALHTNSQYDALGRLVGRQTKRAAAALGSQALDPAGMRNGASISRQYRYDNAGLLAHLQDWRHSVAYGYDSLGQLLSADVERFVFDPAHNLLQAIGTGQVMGTASAGRVERNRLVVFQDQRFAYDSHGRLTSKRSGAHTHLQLHWNAEHQLERSVLHSNGRAHIDVGYAYDPFGRRLYKAPLNSQGQPIAEEATWFVWDGNRLLQEIKAQMRRGAQQEPQTADCLTHTYVYEPESFVPLAQLRTCSPLHHVARAALPKSMRVRAGGPMVAKDKSLGEPVQIRHYHCDHIGTPREVTAEDGGITWQATYRAWGNTASVHWEAVGTESAADPGLDRAANNASLSEAARDDSGLQPLRFQGQYFDSETGLHYNRFRYYDPDCGRFVTQDPIGLAGGDNPSQYALSPTSAIDPLGLCSTALNKSLGGVVGDHKQAHHLIPEEVWGKHKSFLDRIGRGDMRDHRSNGLLVPDSAAKAKQMKRKFFHCGSHATYSAGVDAKVSLIENDFLQGKISAAEASRQIGVLQNTLRSTLMAPSFGTAPIRIF
jgi:RHS repeat-associated protein